MIRQEDVYKIGVIGRPHGVDGEVSFMFDDDVFDRTDANYLVLEVEGILVPFFIDSYRFHGNSTALVAFDGVTTQEEARELTGCNVYFPKSMSDNEEKTDSKSEVIGYDIVDSRTGKNICKIKTIDNNTANVLFVVSAADGKELLIPASEELIEDVDQDGHVIMMNLPEGLMSVNE